MRNTKQKVEIYNFLKSVHSHPTAETVYKQILKKIPNITLATVYRNLNQLTQTKKILRLEINKEYRYDADIKQHQHCVCEKCGNIEDIFLNNIQSYSNKKFQSDTQFELNNTEIIFKGICNKCQKKNREN